MNGHKLFENTDVIKLTDNDFFFTPNDVKLKNKQFSGKNGYIMIYVGWCPHCRSKEDFWSYFATQFNKNPQYKNEKFRIGVIDVEDPAAKKVLSALKVTSMPRFVHVVVNPLTPGLEDIIDYDGNLDPTSLIGAVCDNSPDGAMCSFDSSVLNPPPINY